MSIFPVRGIAKGGVVTDVDAYNLPIGAWSWGSNVRFRNQSITRAPVFRSVFTGLANASPRFLGADIPANGYDQVIIGYLNGRVTGFASGVETDLTVSGYSNVSTDTAYTGCFLGDVYYVNRNDRAPWALIPGNSLFVTLPNWAPVSAPWTCNILRASNSALCAYGITQNGTYYPNMVLTSEFALEGAVPSTWDYTAGTNNATSNVLSEIEGPIVDVCALGDVMVIYGQNQTWVQFLSGDANIWNYEPLFSDVGAINANCAVEVDKKHFVFGLNDIWMHDGNSKQSICDGITREFIFASINFSEASRCRVVYNKNLKELCFQYVSSDQYCAFTGADGCNRQAVYHITTGTWTFDDLPFVFGATMADLNTVQTWATVPGTWANIGGTWAQQAAGIQKALMMIGDVNAPHSLTESLYGFDLQGPGSMLSFSVDTNATQGWTLIRDGIDLHEIGKDLRGYVQLSSIYPRCRLEEGASPISFSFGSSDYFNVPVTMSPVQTYDGNTLYKLDYNCDGRYLYMSITHNDHHYINLTGFDFDADVLGEF